MKQDNENFPGANMGRMLVLTLEQYRAGILDLYHSIFQSSLEDMLKEGFTIGRNMLEKGIDNMTINELMNEAHAFAEITMDMDDTIDGIVVWDGEREETAVVIISDLTNDREKQRAEVKQEKE